MSAQRAGAALCALGLAFACTRAPYPAPPERRIVPTERPAVVTSDPGDDERVRAIERQCRLRLSGKTAEASLVALDRVREVLGSGCDLATVEHDPLHWLLRCRSDALFESGAYRLVGREVACAEREGARVSPWLCVGSVLRGLLGRDARDAQGGALASLELAVLGHVDRQLLRPGSASHVCSELHTALGFTPRGRWEALDEDALDEQRLYANHQLAWCRAASIAAELGRGLSAQGPTGEASGVELAVLGMGTSWLASQPEGRCPGEASEERADCAEARRVDVLVRFTPRVEARTDVCSEEARGAKSALWCLQDCMERLALGASSSGAGVAAASAPLFVEGNDARDALPVGWYLHRMPATAGRRIALARACDVLGVAPAQCDVR